MFFALANEKFLSNLALRVKSLTEELYFSALYITDDIEI